MATKVYYYVAYATYVNGREYRIGNAQCSVIIHNADTILRDLYTNLKKCVESRAELTNSAELAPSEELVITGVSALYSEEVPSDLEHRLQPENVLSEVHHD